MATVTLLQAEGLATSPNPLTTPAGALVEAINIQVRRKGLYETRRGYSHVVDVDASSGRLTTVADKVFFGIEHRLISSSSGALGTEAMGWFFNYVPRDDTLQRINMVAAADKLWVSDRQYTKAVGFFPGGGGFGPFPAGLPQPGDLVNNAAGWTTPGWMANNTSVAYRVTYVFYQDGRLIESGPSSPLVVTNTTGATRNPAVRLYEQSFEGTVEPQYVRLYRSEAVASTIVPGDELFLAAERVYTPIGGVINIVDTQPESLLGAPLYTNPLTGDGILAANGMPPNGVDVELWDGRLWVANTRTASHATVTLIGVGSPDGLQNNDTITVNGVVYTAKTAPVATTDFLLTTAGTPASNVETTARALVATVNSHNAALAPLGVVARYLSGVDDNAGIVSFEWQTADGEVGTSVTVSRATAWQITQQTTVDAKPHGLAFSKADQPDAFPLTNFILVNTSAAPILRIHALRDKLFVFKTDGLYVVSGPAPYRVDMLDDTAILVSPDAICQCNGVLYAFTQQGMVAITDAGVRIVSLPVEQLIRKTMAEAGVGDDYTGAQNAENLQEFGRKTFAVAYETERLVQFWLAGTLALTFNSLYSVWTINFAPLTQASLARRMAAEPLLTLGEVVRLEWAGVSPESGAMHLWQEQRSWVERKRLDRWDNADQVPLAGSIDFVTEPHESGLELPWLFDTETILPDDVLQVLVRRVGVDAAEPLELFAAVRITGITGGGSLILDSPIAFSIWNLGTDPTIATTEAVISRAIPVFLRYAPITAGEPQATKSFRECTFHFTDYSVEHADIIATTELVTNLPADASQPVEGERTLWTETRTEAEEPILRENKRRLIPRDKARGAQLVIGWAVIEAFCSWVLCGVSVEVDPVSERNSRQ